MNPLLSRRDALKSVSSGFGYLAFAALAAASRQRALAAKSKPLDPKPPHFPARAKRVIFLSMQGAPSHVDMFDYKPQLQKDHGKDSPVGEGTAKLFGSPWTFNQHGDSGLWISELLPQLARQSDELCLLKGMHTDLPNHPQAQTIMHTGTSQFVRPSLGAWTLYGLGTENADLPGFVALNTPAGNAQHFGSAFLPAIYQGARLGSAQASTFGTQTRRGRRRPEAPPVPNIKNTELSKAQQRIQLDYLKALNEEKLARETFQPAVEGAIESFELGFRMQDTLPALLDLKGESEATKKLYGIGSGGPGSGGMDAFGKQCLLARRCVEAGVRFVEVTHGNWDHHRNLRDDLAARCHEIDQPIAGLLADLKARDLLKDTLVVWAGEFGRTPYGQGGDGRDHNNKGYTTWMAGGGVKGGFHPPPARPRPRTSHLQLRRPRFPADRCAWFGGERDFCLIGNDS